MKYKLLMCSGGIAF